MIFVFKWYIDKCFFGETTLWARCQKTYCIPCPSQATKHLSYINLNIITLKPRSWKDTLGVKLNTLHRSRVPQKHRNGKHYVGTLLLTFIVGKLKCIHGIHRSDYCSWMVNSHTRWLWRCVYNTCTLSTKCRCIIHLWSPHFCMTPSLSTEVNSFRMCRIHVQLCGKQTLHSRHATFTYRSATVLCALFYSGCHFDAWWTKGSSCWSKP